MEPVRDRLFFAGEAVHETLWGTVGGAWESGERAADAALKLLGARGDAQRRRSPKALIAWSSGKDSRLGAARGAPRGRLRDRRRADHRHRDIRPRQHAWRARGDLARAASRRQGLPSVIVPIPYPCPNEIYEARMAAALDEAKRRRRHACDLRRSVPRRRAHLSRSRSSPAPASRRCFRSGSGRPMRWRAR